MKNMKKRNRILIIAFILAFILCILGYATHSYVTNYYHANKYANEMLTSTSDVTVNKINDNLIAFEPKEIKAGFIFYPGGKVEFTAYAPLLHELAANGILCIIPHMPANLAVLDSNAAKGLKDYYPDVSRWYMGGHSLGGSMAASYLSKHTDEFEGLILLASYSTDNLSDSGLNIISMYGSNDQVLNLNKYEKYKSNLPNDYKEYIIDGGCHAYFGCYGSQDGDGKPSVTNTEQIHTTVDYILKGISL